MRIVIDLQGAQARHARRGIGRYSLALAQSVARLAAGRHEVHVVLNGAFTETIDYLRDAFEALLPPEAVHCWESPLVRQAGANGVGLQQAAARLREAFLASLRPDVLLVTSMFESADDGATTSCGAFVRAPTAVVLYDLIPLLWPHAYLANAAVRAEYEGKLEELKRCDVLLAISESSRREAVEHLGLPDERCVNISAAADDHFVPRAVPPEEERAIRQRLGLPHPFLLYTGGIDPRKNVEGLIRAFGKLPNALRDGRQLAVVCTVQPPARALLQELARECGLQRDQLVLTGYIADEDLVALYNLCEGFVFPSEHEGFGLPALEAMRCGAPVIASSATSLPEVVGREDALFDPRSDAAMAAALERLLVDLPWREELRAHALRQAQAFSWEATGRKALVAIEALFERERRAAAEPAPPPPVGERTRLAFVSPLPPERTGIADYSADLLPALAQHYAIDVVVEQERIDLPWVQEHCGVLSPAEFLRDAARYDRVLYHFGNSAFHEYMFDLLEQVPGVVVLHDFFLSGVHSWRQKHSGVPAAYWTALLESHGYAEFARGFRGEGASLVYNTPCSFGVLRQALGVIVHSPHARELARQWYGEHSVRHWAEIPLLRQPVPTGAKAEARRQLGLAEDELVVCSFGLLGPIKDNRKLADAWFASELARDTHAQLVFVGELGDTDYGRSLRRAIEARGEGGVRVTGWVSPEEFRLWLQAADVAVQLRTMSQGETSAAVLDCMGAGLPTIVNANGSMAHLPRDAVLMLPDAFGEAELREALEGLGRDAARREELGQRARAFIEREHHPAACAAAYAQAIEGFERERERGREGLLAAIGRNDILDEAERRSVARAVGRSLPELRPGRQLMLDISELVCRDAGTGIQRVVKRVMGELIARPPAGYRVEPVYATEGEPGYRYARRFTTKFLECPTDSLPDDPVDCQAGDIFVGLDLQGDRVAEQVAFYERLRRQGVTTTFVVYDLLPLQLPHCFFPGAAAGHERWLRIIAQSDGLIGISKAVADEATAWLEQARPARAARPLRLGWFHLGADVNGAETPELSAEDEQLVERMTRQPTFLMVGTLEPRKGHRQALEAFEQLWRRGVAAHLVIVGKPGWMVEELAERLRKHPQRDSHLFWLERANDAVLEALYARSTALLAASEGEGFGLPLVEGAQHKLPLIARDIPVFREVAREHAFYFSGPRGEDLASAIESWLALHARGEHPRSDDLPWLTWAESAQQFADVVVKGGWQSEWKPRS